MLFPKQAPVEQKKNQNPKADSVKQNAKLIYMVSCYVRKKEPC